MLKVPGDENPANLMTKHLHMDVINNYLHELNLRSVKGNEVRQIVADGAQRTVKEKQAVEKMPDKKVRVVEGKWADEEDRDGGSCERQLENTMDGLMSETIH